MYENTDYETAIEKYEEALKESSKLLANSEVIDEDFTTFVNLKIAMCYVKLAKQSEDTNDYYEKALQHIEQAAATVTLDEYEEKLTHLWGYALYKSNKFEQAKEKLRQLIERFPNSRFREQAEEIIAEITPQPPHPNDLKNGVPPVWRDDPSKFEEFNKKSNKSLSCANRLRAKNAYVKAAEQYGVFANTNPFTTAAAYALYWGGWCYYKEAANDITLLNKSSIIFQKLVDNHSDSPYIPEAREKLKEIKDLKLKSESTQAIIAAEEAVHRVQQSDCQSDAIHEAITHLGNAKREQEQENYAEALMLANKAQTIAHDTIDNHETAKRYVNQGYTYLNQGRLEMATKKARDALNIDPSYQHANTLLEEIKQRYFDQGTNYVEIEEYDKAISLLKKVIAIDSQFKEAYCNLGRAHLKLGEFEQAITAAEKALAIDMNYECAKNIISSIDIDEN